MPRGLPGPARFWLHFSYFLNVWPPATKLKLQPKNHDGPRSQFSFEVVYPPVSSHVADGKSPNEWNRMEAKWGKSSPHRAKDGFLVRPDFLDIWGGSPSVIT